MAISGEFVQAVEEKNLLRVRIMLKDSLLLDKTFRMFDEMKSYSENQGLSIWDEPTIALEKEKGPWSEDVMNYELTALINDFTEEHVKYVKDIITDVYKVGKTPYNTSYQQNMPQKKEQSITQIKKPDNSFNAALDYYQVILDESKNIRLLLKSRRDEMSGRIRFYDRDIEYIKGCAQLIVEACDSIQRR